MANNDIDGQAQAGQDTDANMTAPDQWVDPLDAGENTRSDEVSEIEKYEQEKEAFLNGLTEEDEIDDQEQSDDDEQSEGEDQDDANSDADEDFEQEEEQESEEENEEEEEAVVKTSDRFRFKSDEDKAVAALAKAKGISLVDAARIYAGDAPQAKTSEADQQTDQPTSKSTYKETLSRIEQLEEEELEAISLVDVDRQVEIKKELRMLSRQAEEQRVNEAQAQRQAEAQRQADFDAKWEESSAKAMSAYPGLNDPKSAIYKKVQELDRAAQENGDPVFNSPSKLWDLAKQAAYLTGTLMAKTTSSPSKTSPVKEKGQVTSMKPASRNARTSSATESPGFDAKIEDLGSLAEYERLVGRA